MKQLLFSFFLYTGISLCFGQKSQAEQLDSIFSMMHQQHQFNGTVLIAENGRVILKKGYGCRNEETRRLNEPRTLFETASCSKQFTAGAIVLLKRAGKLDYSDKISTHLPELNFWQDVHIYDLLRHTSGIPEYIFDMQEGWDRTKIATNEDVIRFYAQRKDSLEFVPGSRHRYCNTNYALLASIIERVSGKKYPDFMQEYLFKPLKMKNTLVYNRRLHPLQLENYATGYVWARNSFEKVTSEHPAYGDSSVYFLDGVMGNAKVCSSVEDLYKWITALKKNTLFTQQEFDEMTKITQTSGGRNIPYGFGLDLSKGENRFAFGHTGSWDGYVSFMYHNMLKDRTIIVLENFRLGAYPFDNIAQILDGVAIEPEYRQKTVLPEAEMTKYAGTYISEDGKEEHIISYREGHLFYNTPKVQWDLRFFPVSAGEFQGIRQGGMDGLLKFSEQEDGNMLLEMSEYGEIVGSGLRKK